MWRDLSDAELRVRLEHRGANVVTAALLVDHRDDDEPQRVIDHYLGDGDRD